MRIAARHWRLGVERMLWDKQYIPHGQYTEIRYEELMQDPIAALKRILVFCDLPWTQDFQEHVDSFSLESRNFKWTNSFTPEQIATIGAEIDPLLEKCGFI